MSHELDQDLLYSLPEREIGELVKRTGARARSLLPKNFVPGGEDNENSDCGNGIAKQWLDIYERYGTRVPLKLFYDAVGIKVGEESNNPTTVDEKP